MRICTKCKKEFQRTQEHFPPLKNSADGMGPWCRNCCRIATEKYKKTKAGKTSRIKAKQKYKGSSKGKIQAVKSNMMYHYGIDIKQYDKMLEDQGGGCAICGKPELGRRLSIDHCHDTGVIRGLLCTYCNLSLGVYESRKNELEKYLKRGI